MSDLAQRLVACPRFRWMPGMSATNSQDTGVVTKCWYESYDTEGNSVGAPIAVFAQFDEECPAADIVNGWVCVPDLTDPATIGALWSLVMDIKPPSPDHSFTRHLNEAQFLAQFYGPLHEKVVRELVAALEAAP